MRPSASAIRDVRPEPQKLLCKLAEHRPAVLVAHELAAPGELGFEKTYREAAKWRAYARL